MKSLGCRIAEEVRYAHHATKGAITVAAGTDAGKLLGDNQLVEVVKLMVEAYENYRYSGRLCYLPPPASQYHPSRYGL
jgi:hypothetical protein